jgi:hypothetical protein
VKSQHLISLILFLVGITLTGCTKQPTPALSPLNSVIPTPVPTATPMKLVDSTKGGVTGRFILRSTNQPISDVAIYLGEQLPINNGESYAITVQQSSSPHVPTDQNGKFSLVDIKPGTYALVLWTPKRTMVVADPKQATKELQVVVNPGQITNLGDVVSDMP